MVAMLKLGHGDKLRARFVDRLHAPDVFHFFLMSDTRHVRGLGGGGTRLVGISFTLDVVDGARSRRRIAVR